ncbi:MAG: type II toxin-antitoxin system RelE/ParE family toxin [Maricaulaceae bacterium]|nr:type II toxin-antitoxin system RelE/ParE family toxin [Maricaulaceae bacterium]
MKLRLTATARGHLAAIHRYTLQEYGPAQARQYREHIEAALTRLLEHPQSGTPAEAFRPGLRSLPAGRHRIFYRLQPGIAVILAILHERQSPDRLFGNDQTPA